MARIGEVCTEFFLALSFKSGHGVTDKKDGAKGFQSRGDRVCLYLDLVPQSHLVSTEETCSHGSRWDKVGNSCPGWRQSSQLRDVALNAAQLKLLLRQS